MSDVAASPTAALTSEQLVRVAFLIRLVALGVSLGGLVGQQLTIGSYLAVLLLACVSYLGLAVPRTRQLLVRHPMLAMTDVALVTWVVMQLGVQNPLVLATVSTALLIGILYPLPFAVLPAAVLVFVNAGQAFTEQARGAEMGFLIRVGMPAILAMLVFVGHAVRVIQSNERRALAELAHEREAVVADRERSRLAREMHDGMAKSLQGLALTAAGLPRWLDRDVDRAKLEARSIAEGAGRAVQEARALLTQLRLDDSTLDLKDMVERVAGGWRANTGRSLDVRAEAVPALPVQARYELLCALQEALENLRRHAPDANAELRLRSTADGVRLELIDDGPGFDPGWLAQSEAAGHFGVRGMTERLETVGGRAAVNSAPGAGTRVVLIVEGAADREPAGPRTGRGGPR